MSLGKEFAEPIDCGLVSPPVLSQMPTLQREPIAVNGRNEN